MPGPTQGDQQAPQAAPDNMAGFTALVAELTGRVAATEAAMAAVQGAMPGKASVDALAAKASLEALASLATVVGLKAQAADLTAAAARVTTLEGLQAGYAAAAALTAAVARIAALEAVGPSYVVAGAIPVATLIATYPANAARLGKRARVSDYGGFVDRELRCDFDSNSALYFWNPLPAEYARTLALTASMTLYRLSSPPCVTFTGTIAVGVTRNVTIDLANGRPGEIIEIKAGLSSLLGTLNVLGTGLGSGVGTLLGDYRRFVIDASTGSMQLVRLV